MSHLRDILRQSIKAHLVAETAQNARDSAAVDALEDGLVELAEAANAAGIEQGRLEFVCTTHTTPHQRMTPEQVVGSRSLVVLMARYAGDQWDVAAFTYTGEGWCAYSEKPRPLINVLIDIVRRPEFARVVVTHWDAMREVRIAEIAKARDCIAA